MTRNYEKIPQFIKDNGKFCCWNLEERNGRNTKVPYNPIDGFRAKSNDENSFVSFDEAVNATGYSGIGLGIFGNIGAIDLDHCVDEDGTISAEAFRIVNFMKSYTEYSPSGRGLHIIFEVDEDYKFDSKVFYIMNHKSGIEVYIAGATSKYVTVTGNEVETGFEFGNRTFEIDTVLNTCMRRDRQTVEDDTNRYAVNAINAVNSPQRSIDVLELAMNSKNGEDFTALWNGNWEGRYPSQSEADMALCSHLAFWTGKDANLMDILFRDSSLMRDKWNREQSGSTYGQITINNAISNCTSVYQGRGTRYGRVRKITIIDDSPDSSDDGESER